MLSTTGRGRLTRARRVVGVVIAVTAMLVAMTQVAATAHVEDPGGDFEVCGGEFWVKWEAGGGFEASSDWPGEPPTVTIEVVVEGDDGPWQIDWTSSEMTTVLVGVKASTNIATWPGGTSGTVTGWTEEKDEGQTVEHAISFVVFCYDLTPGEVTVTKTVVDPDGRWNGEPFAFTLAAGDDIEFSLDDGATFAQELAVGEVVSLTETDAQGADATTMTLAVDGGDAAAYDGGDVTIEAGRTYDFAVTNIFEAEEQPLTPAIELVKTADPTQISFTSDGPTEAVVTYTYTVTNTGDATLIDVAVFDDTLGLPVSLPVTELAPGESTVGTLELTVTPDDAGVIDNLAIATATTADEQDVSDTDTATVTITVVSPQVLDNAAIEVIKTPDVTEIAYNASDGDDEVVTYTYTVTNIGAVTLFDITLVDDVLGPITLAVTTLAPGESTVGTATYVVTAADVGTTIVNVATVAGTSADGRTVTDDDDAQVTVSEVLGLQITKQPKPAAEELAATGAPLLALLLAALASLMTGTTLVRRRT